MVVTATTDLLLPFTDRLPANRAWGGGGVPRDTDTGEDLDTPQNEDRWLFYPAWVRGVGPPSVALLAGGSRQADHPESAPLTRLHWP